MAKGSLKGWAAAAMIVIVGGCSEPVSPAPAPAPPPVAEAPPPPPVVSPPLALGSRDTCGADPLQYLIGKPRTDIPVPVNPSMRRVVCSSCVVTQEFNAGRQTIIYDKQTGLVRQVRCG